MMKINSSVLIAIFVALLAAGWLLSGQIGINGQSSAKNPQYQKKQITKTETKVQIRKSKAKEYTPTIRVTGETQSSREVTIRTQIPGKVLKTIAAPGDQLDTGTLIIQLEAEDWPERLEEAHARVKQRQLEFDAAQKLSIKGFKAETKYAAALANLAQAQAVAKRTQQNLSNTTIRAPFSGTLTSRFVEIGDVLKKGDPVAHVIDLQPAIISAFIAERHHTYLKKGQKAHARFSNGSKIPGIIRYISPVAQKSTRTFKVELEINNSSKRLVEGVTAELLIPLPSIATHKLSAALFSLGRSGEIGIKIIDNNNIVRFHAVKIVGSSRKEVFIAGLPDECNIIVVGQGFVQPGEKVNPFPEGDVKGGNS
ncbi:MAG: hypothetical protein CMM58_14015 [Rhodospirillaceae bacterium]|nr:hypothetical protein [Rhodospirillaceae bacterium]|tara:strand:+ start:113 stop:1213 length:1101 start_codon:yes stop_codon:yes gene_type:complete